MVKNLVIVESPAKAKTIEKFLGKDFVVKSSMGHVRDLPEKNLGIDIDAGFVPLYEILTGKKKIISELQADVKKSDVVWLATDEDREGEAISWHLMETLNIPQDKTRRIAFHEITKTAILEAISNPRALDINLVNAQQARRVLDRIVGFELSPVLWRKVKPSLSAGRVQSVAVRLIVEKEKEINKFQSESSYRVVAQFFVDNSGKKTFQAELDTRFATEKEATAFLKKCKDATFVVTNIAKNPVKRSPAAPFTTSTLQQEAARKLGFSVSKTMLVSQQLYEAGYITYMRTDSVNLSNLALAEAKKQIEVSYGEKYAKIRKYNTKTKGAQEAHEAIRPTHIEQKEINTGDSSQNKLYELIWKRTIASQMSDAQFEKTNVTIDISTTSEKFVALGEVMLFDGFLKVYLESRDDEEDNDVKENVLPILTVGTTLTHNKIDAVEKYSHQPYRYTEASLVKKLEELGIGRPSTYAPIISTIQKRQYVVKSDKEGFERAYNIITLQKDEIKHAQKNEKVGYEKGKLLPTDIGIVVNDFLVDNFTDIMDYNFTAKVEKQFDDIASGKLQWNKMLTSFYKPFHKEIDYTLEHSEKVRGERLLGTDPTTGLNIYAKLGPYGAMVQIGESNSENEKPKFAKLLPSQSIETITYKEALLLFQLPRIIGTIEGEDLLANIGRFGPYIKYKNKFYSIPKGEDMMTIELNRALEIIAVKDDRDAQKAPILIGQYQNEDVYAAVGRFGPYVQYNKHFYSLPAGTDVKTLSLEMAIDVIQKTDAKNNIKTFDNDLSIKVLNGRYGPYISKDGNNYKIPKDINPIDLTYEQCLDIVASEEQKSKKVSKSKKTTSTASSKTSNKSKAKTTKK